MTSMKIGKLDDSSEIRIYKQQSIPLTTKTQGKKSIIREL